MKTLTPAQKRAIEWLPADGSWRTDAGRLVCALNSASLAGLADGVWADCGARGFCARIYQDRNLHPMPIRLRPNGARC
jgi:hypothetical protein